MKELATQPEIFFRIGEEEFRRLYAVYASAKAYLEEEGSESLKQVQRKTLRHFVDEVTAHKAQTK